MKYLWYTMAGLAFLFGVYATVFTWSKCGTDMLWLGPSAFYVAMTGSCE